MRFHDSESENPEIGVQKYKVVSRRMINRFTYNVICQINGRTHGSNCNTDDIFPDQLFSYLINKLLTLEMHYPHSYISSQTDKNRINKIKVKKLPRNKAGCLLPVQIRQYKAEASTP